MEINRIVLSTCAGQIKAKESSRVGYIFALELTLELDLFCINGKTIKV
jgi:hypothetical protein